MIACKDKILQLKVVRENIKFSINSKKIICIGVDGPTASGKTVFANLLKSEIGNYTNKNIQIIPLDSLLVERSIREKSLQNIKKINIPFEHEAEIHMRFSKLEKLIELIKFFKAGLENQKEIILKNLYSREDKGKCTGELKINLSNQTILIFEGHYTTRPEFTEILDKNYILLANREILIERKIARVSGYRDKKEVEQYFDLIDEPSYLSNYFRFATHKSLIVDNSDFSNPFSVDYFHIKSLLKADRFLNPKTTYSNNIREFTFGLHGLSNYSFNKNNIENLLFDLNKKENLESKNVLSNVLSNYQIPHKIFYLDYLSKTHLEIGFAANLFEKNIFWILRKSSGEIKNFLFWEGGAYKIEDGAIKRLISLLNKENNFKLGGKDFWNHLAEDKSFLSTFLIKHDSKGFDYCFLSNSRKVSFLSSALKYSQFDCKSLGDFFAIFHRSNSNKITHKILHDPIVFENNKLNLSTKKSNFYQKKSNNYFLTSDFLILYANLNNNILKELKDIYFSTSDMQIRASIMEGLLHEENKLFVNDDFRNYLNYSKDFFPISMSRLYILKKLGLEQSNVLAASIYDITKDPIDSSTYLNAALENSLPIIFQASLNAIGQNEIDANGSNKVGYLKPKEGVWDFTNSICDVVVKYLNSNNFKKIDPPLFGVGLDHIDVRGDIPIGRSSRFVSEAVNTETITHLTLDGSEYFKPSNKEKLELYKSYVEVFNASLNFLDRTNIDVMDLEFCTGELNYIGNNTLPHYPDGDEISMLPLCFNSSINDQDTLYKTNLSNSLKLYVANLGTTHHGNDDEKLLKVSLAKIWQKALEGTTFVSPVLHGTTGSIESTFLLASKSCYKINIAGSFLRILLENLTSTQKKVLGFNFFNEKSKYICSKLNLIKKDKELFSNKELKKEFLRYSKINNVKPISGKSEKIIRKPLYGRNKIAYNIFSKLEQKVKT